MLPVRALLVAVSVLAVVMMIPEDAGAWPRLRRRCCQCPCGRAASDIAPVSTAIANGKPRGYDSPAKAYRAYLTGWVSMDYDQMLSALTPESQAYHIGLSVFAVSYFFGKEGSEQVLREHGFVAAPSPNQEGELDDTAFVKAMLAIKDPGRLMKKAVDREIWIATQMAGAIRAQESTKSPTTDEIVAAVTIKNVSVTGDTAEATVELAQPAKDALANMRETKLVKFRRIENRWYCNIDPR